MMLTLILPLCGRKEAAAARRKLGHVVAGVDLDRAFATYRKLPPFKGNLGTAVRFEVAHRSDDGTSGKATVGRKRKKIRICAGADVTPARVLEVLVHEMTHIALPPYVHHSERFRLTFRRAARECWGIDVPLNVPASQGCIAYGMGEVAIAELERRISAGEIDTFPPKPRPAKPSRAELTSKTVEKRAAHAVSMLTRAEKRSKAAQRALTRWKKKVRYYERQAAKKAST